jgi:protein required for attachment to host cells
MFRIPRDALVFVGDGRKALFLRNTGDALSLRLTTEQVFGDVNPMTNKQGNDRPGRVSMAALPGRKSAVEATDWHDLEEHRFARVIASAIEQMVRINKVKALVIVAPPRILADLRDVFDADVKARVVAEIGRDLTGHTVGEIEKHLVSEASA